MLNLDAAGDLFVDPGTERSMQTVWPLRRPQQVFPLHPPRRRLMDDIAQTPEELIANMSNDELQELLGELGFDATDEQAAGIKDLVAQLGSLEAAIGALEMLDDLEVRRAA